MKNFKDLKETAMRVTIADEFHDMFKDLFKEIDRAETKHPVMVKNMADALLVIGEELGEAQQAYINHAYTGADKELIRKELIETAATIFRALLNFDELVKVPDTLDQEPQLTHYEKCKRSYKSYCDNWHKNPPYLPAECQTFEQWYKIFGNNAGLKSDFDEPHKPIRFFNTGDSSKKKVKESEFVKIVDDAYRETYNRIREAYIII